MASISVCMIVRNEEDCLTDALESVQGIASEIVVVDTGSTDKTMEIAEAYGARVFSLEWENDFAKARNASIDKASGDWLFILDADERLRPESREALVSACCTDAEGFTVKIVSRLDDDGDMEVSTSVRLFRHRPEYRFQGRIHEQVGKVILHHKPGSIVDSQIVLDHLGYLRSFVERKGKQSRNLDFARLAALEHPDDPFARFNLGVEYYRVSDYRAAIEEFKVAERLICEPLGWIPKMVKTWALCHLHSDEAHKAIEVCEHGTTMYPDYTDLFYVLGLAHQRLGEYEAAETVFRHCLKMGNAPVPPYAAADMGAGGFKARFALGRVLLQRGDYAEAANEFRAAYEQNPVWMLPLVLMGSACRASDREESFVEYLDSLSSDSVWKGEILCKAWLYRPALRILEDTAPGREADFLKACALLGTGQFDEADGVLKQLEESLPGDRDLAVVRRLWKAGCDVNGLDALSGQTSESKTAAQFLYIRSILALEDAVRRHPAQHLVREELDRMRREAARWGLRGV